MCTNKFSIGGLVGVHVRSIVNETIRTILSLFIFFFLLKNFKRTKTQIKPKPTKKTKKSKQNTTKATIFQAHKNFLKGRNCLFCILVLFVRLRSFHENKQVWNCPDNLIYNTTKHTVHHSFDRHKRNDFSFSLRFFFFFLVKVVFVIFPILIWI